MINKIQNLDGVEILNKAKQNSILGGSTACFEVTCEFPDGLNWVGSTNSQSVVSGMESHCNNSGGNPVTVDNCIAGIQ